jgi:hypothetical protein
MICLSINTQAEYGTMEGLLLFVPPHLASTVGDDFTRLQYYFRITSYPPLLRNFLHLAYFPLPSISAIPVKENKCDDVAWLSRTCHYFSPNRDHGLWQKRHFVFYPIDNTLECFTALVPGTHHTYLCFSSFFMQLGLLYTNVRRNSGL